MGLVTRCAPGLADAVVEMVNAVMFAKHPRYFGTKWLPAATKKTVFGSLKSLLKRTQLRGLKCMCASVRASERDGDVDGAKRGVRLHLLY